MASGKVERELRRRDYEMHSARRYRRMGWSDLVAQHVREARRRNRMALRMRRRAARAE